MSARVLFRRSRYLVSYWAGDRLLFENYATGSRAAAAPEVLALLHSFSRWRSADSVLRELRHLDRASLRRAIRSLERYSFLRRSTSAEPRLERALRGWSTWLPAAGWFHLSTKDIAYRDPEDFERHLKDKAQNQPPPAKRKRYRDARQFALPPPIADGDFPKVLLERRTWRQFSPRPVPLPALSTVLHLTWGIQRWIDVPGVERVPLKTSPSGGARHPIEAYVLARRVEGLPRGLFHYAADAHKLELLKSGATRRHVRAYLPQQWWYADAAALLIMTAVFSREQWRYETPRAYRAVLIEAGHLCQTFYLVATWLGLAPFCTLALADSLIERDLGIDGIGESVLYIAGVGTRPAGVDWAPFPNRRRASSSAGRAASASLQKRRNC